MLSVLSQVNQVWCSFFDANFTKEQILQILQSERKNTLFLLLIFFCSRIKWSKLLSPLILFINTYSVLTRQELFYWKYNSTLWLATKSYILSTFILSTSSFIFQIHESIVEFLTFFHMTTLKWFILTGFCKDSLIYGIYCIFNKTVPHCYSMHTGARGMYLHPRRGASCLNLRCYSVAPM